MNIKNQILSDLKMKCDELSINGYLTMDKFNDLLTIFERNNIFTLRKTPLSKRMFFSMDMN